MVSAIAGLRHRHKKSVPERRYSDTADVTVVGAGSSGCVVASRLSENPEIQVLVLEAGPPDDSPWIKKLRLDTRNCSRKDDTIPVL